MIISIVEFKELYMNDPDISIELVSWVEDCSEVDSDGFVVLPK